ncbi:MAG: HAD family hydrolase [Deltaproteobacteria bacterium]|nr:HAD family hydrolase [Deltaproteobacteria bacterium]
MSTTATQRRAVFLDRDGVLIVDRSPLLKAEQIELLPGVVEALCKLRAANFALVVVTNQTVVARGWASEAEVQHLQDTVADRIVAAGGPALDGMYFCPHHPHADLPAYRQVCQCRKPRPGMLLRAAAELEIDLRRSFMVGDRITDIVAGARADCRTVQVTTGYHDAPPIVTVDPLDPNIMPEHRCSSLAAASDWICVR